MLFVGNPNWKMTNYLHRSPLGSLRAPLLVLVVCEDMFPFKCGIVISVILYVSGLLGDHSFDNLCVVCLMQTWVCHVVSISLGHW